MSGLSLRSWMPHTGSSARILLGALGSEIHFAAANQCDTKVLGS